MANVNPIVKVKCFCCRFGCNNDRHKVNGPFQMSSVCLRINLQNGTFKVTLCLPKKGLYFQYNKVNIMAEILKCRIASHNRFEFSICQLRKA